MAKHPSQSKGRCYQELDNYEIEMAFKTATKNGLKEKFHSAGDVAVIHVTLTSVEFTDITWSIIDYSTKEGWIDDAFLQTIDYEEKDIKTYTKPKLLQIIFQIIEKLSLIHI